MAMTASPDLIAESGTPYGRTVFFRHDDPIGRALLEYGEWAAAEIKLLCAFIGLGSSVVDVGANVGTHTLAFARRVGPHGSVLAIEPQRLVFELLEQNLAANGLTHVKAIRAGLGSRSGEMFTSFVDPATPINIGGLSLHYASEETADERVDIQTLDHFELPSCNLVKIDVEGMGSDVLSGMAGTIARLRPVISIECNTVAEGADVIRQIAGMNYRSLLICSAAFNAKNFNRNVTNIFGVAMETSILLVPDEAASLIPTASEGTVIKPFSTLDEFAAAMMATPRYGDETAIDRDPERLRAELRDGTAASDLRAAENRVKSAQAEIEKLRRDAARDVARLDFRATSLAEQLRQAEGRPSTGHADLTLLQERLAEAERKLAEIQTSTSWNVTAPIRIAKRVLLNRKTR